MLYLYHGFQGVWDLYTKAVVCLPKSEENIQLQRVQIPCTLETHGTDDLIVGSGKTRKGGYGNANGNGNGNAWKRNE